MADNSLVEGFVAGLVVVALLVLIFCVGLNQGAASVQNKCDAYGKAKIGDVMYECKKVAT
jgi:hypothetical protein